MKYAIVIVIVIAIICVLGYSFIFTNSKDAKFENSNPSQTETSDNIKRIQQKTQKNQQRRKKQRKSKQHLKSHLLKMQMEITVLNYQKDMKEILLN